MPLLAVLNPRRPTPRGTAHPLKRLIGPIRWEDMSKAQKLQLQAQFLYGGMPYNPSGTYWSLMQYPKQVGGMRLWKQSQFLTNGSCCRNPKGCRHNGRSWMTPSPTAPWPSEGFKLREAIMDRRDAIRQFYPGFWVDVPSEDAVLDRRASRGEYVRAMKKVERAEKLIAKLKAIKNRVRKNSLLPMVAGGIAAGVAGAVTNRFLRNGKLLSGIAPDGTKYVVKKDREWNEWQVVAYVKGKRHEGRTYHASDKADAVGTFYKIVGKQIGHVEIGGPDIISFDMGGGVRFNRRSARNPLTDREFKHIEQIGMLDLGIAKDSIKKGFFSDAKEYAMRTYGRMEAVMASAGGNARIVNRARRIMSVAVKILVAGRRASRNPLTARESAALLRDARGSTKTGAWSEDQMHRSFFGGKGVGTAHAVQTYGTKRAKRLAIKARVKARNVGFSHVAKYGAGIDSPEDYARFSKGARRNPGAGQDVIAVPFRQGRKYSVSQVQNWVERHGTPAMKQRFAQAMAQYRRFHKGSLPKYITYSLYKMGSHKGISDVEFGVSEGREWMAAYQVPRSSGKWMDKASGGRYVHAHGDSDIEVDIKRPVKLSKLPLRFHTPDGKAVGVIPSKNVKIGEWYEG